MREIVFVDDEVNILDGLQRSLHPLRREWRMRFASSGAQALALLETCHADVVISDMRMPGMDGAALLAEVKQRYPDTLRFVLTGQSESEAIYRTVGDAHQFLTKPCNARLLKECIDRALGLKDLLQNDAIRTVVTEIATLPPVPEVYARLCEALKRDHTSVADVGHIIESDPAMTAKLLKLINCAFLGVSQHICSVTQAVALLGLDTVKSLVLVEGLFSYMGDAISSRWFSTEAIRQHSLEVAACARAVCGCEAVSREVQGEAYTAGLLHDAGMLIMGVALHEAYDRAHDYAMEHGVALAAAESALFGCTHSEVGAYLIGIWGLPNAIVEAVAYHHRPEACRGKGFSPLTAVHVADVAAMSAHEEDFKYFAPQFNAEYLEAIGLSARLPAWCDACAGVGAIEEG